MVIYRFKPAGRADHRVALSVDNDGKNLPENGAPWQPIGQLDLSVAEPWVKASKVEIEDALTTKGFFVWTISVPQPAKSRW